MPTSKTTSWTPEQQTLVDDWVEATANAIASQINMMGPTLLDLDKRPQEGWTEEQPNVFFRYAPQAMLEDLIHELESRV